MIRSAAETEGIAFVNPVGYVSTVFKTDKTFAGGLLKDLDSTYRWNAFKNYLKDGRLPEIGLSISREILLSKHIARALGVKTGDRVSSYFLFENRLPIRRSFVVTGLYDSGFRFRSANCLCRLATFKKYINGPAYEEAFEITLDNFDDIRSVFRTGL